MVFTTRNLGKFDIDAVEAQWINPIIEEGFVPVYKQYDEDGNLLLALASQKSMNNRSVKNVRVNLYLKGGLSVYSATVEYQEFEDFLKVNPSVKSMQDHLYMCIDYKFDTLPQPVQLCQIENNTSESLKIVATVTGKGIINVETDQDAIGFVASRYARGGNLVYWGRGPRETEQRKSSHVVVDMQPHEKKLIVNYYPDGSFSAWVDKNTITINYQRTAKQVFFIQSPQEIIGPEVLVKLVDNVEEVSIWLKIAFIAFLVFGSIANLSQGNLGIFLLGLIGAIGFSIWFFL